MEKESFNTDQTTSKPLEITQAITGLQLDNTDISLLRYLDFFSQQVPFHAIYFMHVIPDFSFATSFLSTEASSVLKQEGVVENKTKSMEEEIDAYLKNKEALYVEYDVIEGDPLEQLLLKAEKLKVDLVIAGQRKGKGHHGILAKNLIRKTSANALLVPKNSAAQLTTILVPIDFSPNATRALQTAIQLHRQVGESVRIICLYIYTLPAANLSKIDQTWDTYQRMVESNITRGFWALLDTIAPDYSKKIDWQLVEKGKRSVTEAIENQLVLENVDFLVLGAKGHSKVHLLLMGSVAESLLESNESIPVLIVK